MNNKTVIQQFATTAQVSEYGKGLVATTLFALPSTAEPLSIGILPQDNEFLLTDFGIACEILERNQVDVQEVLPKILEIFRFSFRSFAAHTDAENAAISIKTVRIQEISFFIIKPLR